MSANFAVVDALTGFLRETRVAPESAFEKLGRVLSQADNKGLTMVELMSASGLDRAQFLESLINGTTAGLFEKAGKGDGARIRLTEQGKNIY
jgi:hypothetical protein